MYSFSFEEIRTQALQKMSELGLLPRLVRDRDLIIDGRIHRYDIDGQKRGSKNGAYLIYSDGRPSGFFQDWSNPDAKYTWSIDFPEGAYSKPSDFDIKKWQEEREKKRLEDEKKQEDAAELARIKFENAQAGVFEHEYLTKKGLVSPHGVRLSNDGRLLVPLVNADMKITSLQFIGTDGRKMFMGDGKTQGSFFPFNLNELSPAAPAVLVGEGFATMARIFELVRRPCVAAMSSGNLTAVCSVILERCPYAKIILMADNDLKTQETKKFNPGLDAAQKCSDALAPSIVAILYPPFENSVDGSDWDDYINFYGEGSDAVKKMLRDVAYYSADEAGKRDIEQRELIARFSYVMDTSKQLNPLDIIGGLFPRGYVSALIAPPGTGKTMLIQKFVSDLSVGGNILDGFVDNEPFRRSLIFSSESGYEMLIRRATSLKWKFNPDFIRIVDQYTLTLNDVSVFFDDPVGLDNVRKFIEVNKADIVFFDSFMNFHNVDENRSYLMKPILISLMIIARDLNVAIVLVHHTRKRTAKERVFELHQDDAVGSGILNRFVAQLVGIERSKEQRDIIYVHCLKAWEKEFPSFRYRISENESGAGVFESYLDDKDSGESASIQSSKESVWSYLSLTFKRGEWFKREDVELEVFDPPISVGWLRKIISGFVKNGKLLSRGTTRTMEYSII